MLVTVCFLLYELFDPVWLMMRREWLFAIILTCITLLLVQNKRQRMFVMLMALFRVKFFIVCLSQNIHFHILQPLYFHSTIMRLTLTLIIGWNSLEMAVNYFDKPSSIYRKGETKTNMNEYTLPVIFGVAIGTLARVYMFRTDYRQYPTYLHGKIIHIALGFIAAGLGTVASHLLMEENFTAITFLTVAASQFREVRNMERNTLTD